MTRIVIAALAFVAGCTCSGEQRDLYGYVPPAERLQVQACAQQHECSQLCETTFQLTTAQQLESCGVSHIDSAGGARLHALVTDYSVCSSDDSGDVGIGVDDTGDDGSCDDGSCDDGGDTGDSGGDSGDDTSDDGGDDSGRRAPHVSRVPSPAQINRAAE